MHVACETTATYPATFVELLSMHFKLKLGFVRTDIFYIPRNCQVLVSRQVLSLLTVVAGLTGGIDRML